MWDWLLRSFPCSSAVERLINTASEEEYVLQEMRRSLVRFQSGERWVTIRGSPTERDAMFSNTGSPARSGSATIERTCNHRNCGQRFFVSSGMLRGKVKCPTCGHPQ